MSGNSVDGTDTEEVCPVCKTSSYLNKSLRFLVNPECYHRMCESCVDRIFSQGPAQCPIAGCKKTLRKHRFRKQTFQDLTIEREVDIRRRVMAILNRREDEFETKRDWDDFLEQREEIITNLVMRLDVSATEKQLAEYAVANEASIKANSALERQESNGAISQSAGGDLVANTRKEVARYATGDERSEKFQDKTRILDKLASGQFDGDSGRKERMKGGSRRQIGAPQPVTSQSRLQIKGIKQRSIQQNTSEIGYDPFMGMPITRGYYTLQADYPSTKLSKAKNDTRVLAGGYEFKTFYDESLLRAFAGLGCFIDEEVRERDASTSREVVTAVAAKK